MASQPTDPTKLSTRTEDRLPEHHLGLMRGGGQYWGNCLCGWKSGTHRLAMDVQLRFGEHLLSVPSVREPGPAVGG